MRFRNLIFPFSLALILGGLSAWLERISTVSVEEVKLDPTKPQYIMTGMLAHRFDVSGSLKEELLADKVAIAGPTECIFAKCGFAYISQ